MDILFYFLTKYIYLFVLMWSTVTSVQQINLFMHSFIHYYNTF